MNDKMVRYNKQMGTRKFPYENLWISLRETMGFLTRNYGFPYEKPEASNWGKSLSQLGAYFQRTYVLRNMLLVVMMLMGVNVWGQTDYSGLYYIASGDVEGYVYDPDAPANNYYLVPAANPQQTHYADAYFHNQYCNTSGSGDYTGNNYGDPQKPFLTTYKTNQDNNSLWVLQKSNESGLYYIVHVFTGKYVVYEPPYKDKKNRKSMHLLSTESPGANAKFAITGSSSYQFRPSSVTTGNCFFNPASGNRDQYYGTNNADKGAYWAGGIVGLYSEGSWKLETTLLTAPTISDVDESTNTFTITDANSLPEGYTIRYTTDGTSPTATTGTKYNGPVIVTNNWTVRAVVVRYDMVLTEMQTKSVEPARCKTPVISYTTETGKVSIASETPNANIRYTLNGTDPTSGSMLYGEPFDVTDQQMVKAIAINTDLGFRDSEIASSKLVLNATITLAENECTYDGSAQKPAVSVMDDETTIDDDEYIVSYSNNINAGNEAVVTITDKEGGDYIVYGTTTFTIHPAGVALTANSGTETYDGTEKAATGFICSVDGLTFEGVSASGSGTNAGEYDVTFTGVTINTTKDTSGNYVVNGTTNGTLTISPKVLTITADSDTKVYDGVALTKDSYTNTELVAGDQIESVTVTGSQTIAGTSNNVPSAAVIKKGETDVTANYNITYTNGTLEITKKMLTITADAKSKAYGEADPALTYTSEGLINNDAITGTLTREAGEDAGVYAITQGELTAGNNYAISYTGANLTITKVGLTVTAKNNTITYGDAPAGNGVTYEGFVNSEAGSVLGGTLDYDYSYTQYGDVGNTYTITPKGLTSNNYDISFVAGTLTVNTKEVGIDWTDTAFPYDGKAHAPTATATGLENNDAVIVTVTGAQTNAGVYTATASSLTGDKASNYKLPDANTQSFTISRKSIGDGTLADGYTLDFGESNTILLTDDVIGGALVISTDYSVSDDTDSSDKYSQRRVTGQNNYMGYFDVRNVVISFTTDADQEEWSATFVAEKADESDIGHALPEGVGAFIISDIRGERVIPEPLNYIPEGVPVLLVAHRQINGFVATKAESGDVTPTPITDVQKAKNMLEEVTEESPDYNSGSESVHFDTKQIYVLYKNEFVFNKEGNMKKGKVYLNPNHTVVSPVPAPARLLIAWNYTTGILHLQKGNIVKIQDDVWYTIDGRRLSGKPDTKGLYIVGGKKIVIK